MRTRWPLLAIAILLAATACGGSSRTAGKPSDSAKSTLPAQGSKASTRCVGADGPGKDVVLRAHGSKLVGAEIGTGDTWAVMLHQSDALAMCGWWEYAVWLAEDYQVHVLLFDFCMFGDSQCNSKKIEHDQIAQASLAGTYARRHGARRLTFVGASMGGSVAPEAALATKADAVIDLSGPTDWSGTDINRAALRLAMPTLMAISPDDGEQAVASFRRAYAKVAASHKRLYVPKHGHGYTLLSELGEPNEFARTVASWIVGKY